MKIASTILVLSINNIQSQYFNEYNSNEPEHDLGKDYYDGYDQLGDARFFASMADQEHSNNLPQYYNNEYYNYGEEIDYDYSTGNGLNFLHDRVIMGRGLNLKQGRKTVFPPFGTTKEIEYVLQNGETLTLLAEFVEKNSDDEYIAPSSCEPIQPTDLSDEDQEVTLKIGYKTMRVLLFKAKAKLGLNRFKTIVDFDKDGGNCEPKTGGPVMAAGDSFINTNKHKADYWISNKFSDFNPSNKKKNCNILTQDHGVLFWMCKSSRDVYIKDTYNLLKEAIKSSTKLSNIQNQIPKTRNLEQSLADQITTVGCWCGKLKNENSLMGKPLDYPLDRICYEWSQCLKCATLNDNLCNYNDDLEHGYYVIINGENVSCIDPEDNCELNKCQCDINLLEKIKIFFTNNSEHQIDEKFTNLIENGKFDECPRKEGTPADSCCGDEAPYWKLYNSEKQCCEIDGIVPNVRGC